ncbi:cysteine desulfurase [Patescibacteria group bacterium]|nr:cysteine desulfurase [Patescibacteria group bacterium]MBU1029029.1 cysteine desulfurase [Patescibacteria group bacterium]MBU1916375.1 cysteine desulfurase [Patescibacteria group bacterium]
MSWFKKNRQNDFPTYKFERGAGRPYHFLDSAASALTPKIVLEAMDLYYRTYRANVHRGLYRASAKATASYEAARENIANFLHAAPEEVVFTRGATESLNLVAYSLAATLQPEDEVVISIMEHHANFVPWQQFAQRFGFKLRIIPITKNFELDKEEARKIIGPKTKILSLVHVSNVLGTVNPVKELSALAHQYGATVIVDAAQSVGHRPVDFAELGCDFLAFSGHKTYGPTGIGALIGRYSALSQLSPFLYGGEMIAEVTKEYSVWNEVPHKFEAGTPNIAGAIGLSAAVDYMQEIGLDELAKHERELTAYAIAQLSTIEDVTIIGPGADQDRGGAVSFSVENIHPHDLAHILGNHGVCVRGGHHCAMPLMQELDLPGTTRASFGIYSQPKDIDALVKAVKYVRNKFGS